MGYAELIAKLQTLPDEKQAEVLDFVEFLSIRSAARVKDKPLVHDEWAEAEFSAFSMNHALRGMEDEPVLYTRDDLNEYWQ
jgi:hypothetical protein